MTVGLRHPELFRSVASISGSMVERDFEDRFGKALGDPAMIKKQYRLLWIGCGAGFQTMPVVREQVVEVLPVLFN